MLEIFCGKNHKENKLIIHKNKLWSKIINIIKWNGKRYLNIKKNLSQCLIVTFKHYISISKAFKKDRKRNICRHFYLDIPLRQTFRKHDKCIKIHSNEVGGRFELGDVHKRPLVWTINIYVRICDCKGKRRSILGNSK